MAASLQVSIVIPLFREKSRFKEGLSNLSSFFARFPFDVEVLFIADPDGATAFYAEALSETQRPPPAPTNDPPAAPVTWQREFRLLSNEKRLGRGASLKRGLDAATGQILLASSVDLAIPLSEMMSAIQEFILAPNQTDFVIGNRLSLKRPRHGERRRWKKLFDDIEHEKAQHLKVPDPTCPFWAIRKEVWQSISPQSRMRRWYYSPQILLALREKGHSIKTLDVISHDSADSRFRILDSIWN